MRIQDEDTTSFRFEKTRLPELERVLHLVERAKKFAAIDVLENINSKKSSFPIFSLRFGPDNPKLPCLALFGGVHGLERIGSQTIVSFLESFVARLEWDIDLLKSLKTVRLLALPIVNPAGMFMGRRSNHNGVDLMRNAPIEAEGPTPFLIGGHRITNRIPYYRGRKNAPMELEAQAVIKFCEKEVLPASCSIALDVHSGFGMRDRLWYPYAKSTRQFERLAEVESLTDLLKQSYPNHIYVVEPQSQHYLTHGDLWDYIYEKHQKNPDWNKNLFLPLTLEMGSWLWLKKNPMQILSGSLAVFHPIASHRQKRIFRRHIALFEFLWRASKFYSAGKLI